ncbi:MULTISPECIES: NUDIX domain-containing protein [Methylobacterium]|jgi:8-oxo-dGTP pyrophosphatase MutT (NUDIX family)|uniref:NUDIX domain-containing protein n=1 Tax=Methylobacterium TaxID=407 RepID=UPI0008EE3398|nr:MULTISPECIES: NUDIX domain-containing protein [Methylobacterium]MBZ6415513.1 NUDIX domain-containing protein [Methylobacterium sp.]MBK3395403.1 NUDIX domain-containing protein [Methylobacterium ajmalii]MBK3408727.1 NUDIX domain-containing protein [Methylobacterium ajmalii]MBK3421109.1 NUDIX domain-containing protein [Methylobacterium ajmalii]SFE69923.1 ADP-ribose pyrophosphatase YjhB, NUDIX family [Methylobacterium sp. yr596]
MTRRQALMMRAAHLVWRVTRGMTLGVRGAAIDAQNRVCLVRHTYMPGWHLPGGGIEPGETALDAVTREFREETGIVLDPGAPPALHGFYLNRIGAGRDHVALYVARAFTVPEPKRPDREIAETGFFPLDALPPETTPATRTRLAEIRDGLPPASTW